MEKDYRFYLISSVGVVKNLEEDFVGLRYKEAKGINSVGAVRVYSEEYAEYDGADVYMGSSLRQTDVTISLYFISEVGDYDSVRSSYDAFVKFIRGEKLLWYDTYRGKVMKIHLESAPSVKDDSPKSGYLGVEFKFKNDWGMSYDRSDVPDDDDFGVDVMALLKTL